MKKSSSNKRNVLVIACALALVSLCGAAQAQSVKDTAYLNDTRPNSAKLIACLQPDRRVDIEVIGTRIIR